MVNCDYKYKEEKNEEQKESVDYRDSRGAGECDAGRLWGWRRATYSNAGTANTYTGRHPHPLGQ
jgi:hypothetical protein